MGAARFRGRRWSGATRGGAAQRGGGVRVAKRRTRVLYRSERPHPVHPTKRPLVALIKQARAVGVGVVVATQNPMNLDYRALSNAGLWFIGRLQTDADRARVINGLEGALGAADEDLGTTLTRLAPRWFVVRNAHAASPPILVQPRYAMSLMRGPMTRLGIRAARGVKDSNRTTPPERFAGLGQRVALA